MKQRLQSFSGRVFVREESFMSDLKNKSNASDNKVNVNELSNQCVTKQLEQSERGYYSGFWAGIAVGICIGMTIAHL